MSDRLSKRRWPALLVGLATIAGFIIVAHWVSPNLPGASGAVFRQNVERRINATALFYTEAGSVRDYLSNDGKYGRATTNHAR